MPNSITSILSDSLTCYHEVQEESRSASRVAATGQPQDTFFDNMPKQGPSSSLSRLSCETTLTPPSESNASVRSRKLITAKDVVGYVRKTYYKFPNYKSSNKIHTLAEDVEAEEERLRNAAEELYRLHAEFRRHPKSQHPELARRAKAHNCGELALIVTDELARRGMRAVKVGIGEGGGTHGFSAVLPPGHPGMVEGYDMGDDFDNWDEDIIICCAWMNICCYVRDFKEEMLFLKKMLHWDDVGKELFTNNVRDGYRQFRASDSVWMNAVLTGKKRVEFVPERIHSLDT